MAQSDFDITNVTEWKVVWTQDLLYKYCTLISYVIMPAFKSCTGNHYSSTTESHIDPESSQYTHYVYSISNIAPFEKSYHYSSSNIVMTQKSHWLSWHMKCAHLKLLISQT